MAHPKIKDIFELIKKDAEQRRTDAGYGGEWGDRGASDLLKAVEIYKHGMNGTIPPEWEHYTDKLDHEYVEYERLKKKFGGR